MWILIGFVVWVLLGVLIFRWLYVAVGPKTPDERRRDDEDQARALGLDPDEQLIEAALVDCFGEDAITVKAQTDRPVTGDPRSLPRDSRRVS